MSTLPTSRAETLDRPTRRFLDHLAAERGRSANTLAAYRRDLELYAHFLAEIGVAGPTSATGRDVQEFVTWLRARRTPRGTPYAAATLTRAVGTVRSLHRFLADRGLTREDPAETVPTPASPRSEPQALSVEAVDRLAAVPDDTPRSRRDAAMIETLYAAGLLISELVALDVADLDVETCEVRVRAPGTARLVPVGPATARRLEQWLRGGRPVLAERTAAAFVNRRGARLTRQGAWQIVKRRAAAAGLGEAVSPYTLRHTFAAHLLAGGAEPDVVHEVLGHRRASDARDRPARQRLRDTYDRSHPRGARAD